MQCWGLNVVLPYMLDNTLPTELHPGLSFIPQEGTFLHLQYDMNYKTFTHPMNSFEVLFILELIVYSNLGFGIIISL